MITLENVNKTFTSGGRTVVAVDNVSLTIDDGEIFGVIGQSGAGKSTLVRCVNGLEPIDSGRVVVAGQEISTLSGGVLRAARQQIGMVFQHFNLLSSRTVRRNVEFALEVAGRSRSDRTRRSAEILELVGLSDLADAYPAQLSGGQKQRVGIARALAAEPQVLLSDESTSALDPETTRSILDLFRRINRELGLTILLITHEMDVVKTICSSAALMEHGRVVEHGRMVDLVEQPGSRLARELFPMGETPAGSDALVEVTFTQRAAADSPVIAQLVRTFGIDVSIVGAAIETLDGVQVGRIRVELPGSAERVQKAIDSLRAQSLFVEVLRGEVR